MAPRAVADSKKSVSGGLDVTSTLNNLKEQKSWKNVVDPQLARRQEQEKKKEDERKAAEEARKAEEARVIASRPVAAPTPPPVLGGSHEDWMAAAGIAPSDYGYATFIINHEGGFRPCVVNGGAIDCNYAINGGQRAYGVCQALPGSKMASAGADWATNPITQLRWCNSYAVGRYGSWAGAYLACISKHWW